MRPLAGQLASVPKVNIVMLFYFAVACKEQSMTLEKRRSSDLHYLLKIKLHLN